MSTHVCVWFEDTWPEHTCDCGARAVTVMDDDGATAFVELDPGRGRTDEALPIPA